MTSLEIAKLLFSPTTDPGSGSDEDVARLVRYLAEDVVFKATVPPGTPISGEFRGKQAVADYFERLSDIAVFRQERPQEFLTDGDRVVVIGDDTFEIKRTGATARSEYAMLLEFRDGLIVRWTIFQDLSAFVDAYRAAEVPAAVGSA